jgi:hypothetical protein
MHWNRAMTRFFVALALSISFSIVPTNRLYAQTTPAAAAHDTLVQLTLVSKLDSKSAKVDDPVIAKTIDKVELNGTTIPDGTKLLGKVTAVAHNPATLSIEFDSLQQKGQPAIPIQGILVAVAPPAESDSALQLPAGHGGYVSPSPYSRSGSSDTSNALSAGSSIKNLTLTSGTLSSSKDFKLSGGSRMAVRLSSVSK